MTNELRRWRHRIDHGDVIQSPRGEYVLWADYDELAQAHMTLIGEFQAQEAELEALKHDNERLMKSLNAEVNAHEPSVDAPAFDPTVQCACGWRGATSKLWRIPNESDRRLCPACQKEFRVDTCKLIPDSSERT